MGDDDAVPGGCRGAGQKSVALVLGEIGFVGDQDSGVRDRGSGIRGSLARGNGRERHYGFGDEAKALLFHDRGGNAEGLAGADGMRDISGAGADDAPDHALLVCVEFDDAGWRRQLQMASVEMAGDEIVELVVVDPGEPVGAVGVGPDPTLEGVLDLGELFLCGLRVGGVQDALFLAVLDKDVVDLRDRCIQGVAEK